MEDKNTILDINETTIQCIKKKCSMYTHTVI
jgi:hypothetical protein